MGWLNPADIFTLCCCNVHFNIILKSWSRTYKWAPCRDCQTECLLWLPVAVNMIDLPVFININTFSAE